MSSQPSRASVAQPRSRRKGRRIAATSAVTLAVAGLALAGGSQWTAHQVRASLAGAGVQVAGVSVDPLSGAVTLDGVAASHAGMKLKVGSVESSGAFALASPAEASAAVTLTDIVITGPKATLRIPRLDVAGDNLDEAKLRAIFDKDNAVPLAERLAALSVTRATMPELTLEQAYGSSRSAFRWLEVTVSDLRNGVAREIASASSEFSATTGEATMSGSTGAATVSAAQMAHLARVYTEAAANDADRKPQPVYGAFDVRDIRIGNNGGEVSVRKASGSSLRMGLMNTPLLATLAEIDRVQDPGSLPPKEQAAYFNNVAALLEAFSFGETNIDGLSFDLPATDAGHDADAKETTRANGTTRLRGEIGSLAIAGETGDGALTLKALRATPSDGGEITLASASFSGMSSNDLARFFREQAQKLDAGKDAEATAAFPLVGNFSLDNLLVDLPGDGDGAVKFSLKGYQGSYQKPVNGLPTSIRSSLDNLVIDLPAPGKNDEDADSSVDDTIRKLRAMGYSRIDLSAKLDGDWDEASRAMRVAEASFSIADMGGVRISGLLGNVSAAAFSADTDQAQQALMAARLKTLSLGVSDAGLAGRFAGLQAKEQNGDPATVRAGWAALAQLLLPSVIGTSDGARTLTGALGDFIRQNGAIDITLTARDPEGDVIADIAGLALSGEPDRLFQQFDVKAQTK